MKNKSLDPMKGVINGLILSLLLWCVLGYAAYQIRAYNMKDGQEVIPIQASWPYMGTGQVGSTYFHRFQDPEGNEHYLHSDSPEELEIKVRIHGVDQGWELKDVSN